MGLIDRALVKLAHPDCPECLSASDHGECCGDCEVECVMCGTPECKWGGSGVNMSLYTITIDGNPHGYSVQAVSLEKAALIAAERWDGEQYDWPLVSGSKCLASVYKRSVHQKSFLVHTNVIEYEVEYIATEIDNVTP